MAGTVKFELSSVSPEDSGLSGNCPNGRGNYLGPILDRSGSFREGSESRTCSSGAGTSKGNATALADLPPLSQYLNLDQIVIGDQKYTRAGELRRALGFSFGNVSEDNSFGAAHSKPPLTFATDDLKRFRSSVLEGSIKARNKVKSWNDSLNKLGKYCDALTSKKHQTNERSGGSNMMKMGTQSHRNSPDLVTQKLEERNTSIILNKRARTPMGDMRAERRSNGLLRQHLIMGKDKDAVKEASSDLVEEKIRRLPAGGEGWDKKMKRKRSVSSVFHRSADGDGEFRKTMQGRLANDSVVQTSDSYAFRSGPSNGANGVNKLDGTSSPASLSGRMASKNEPEKASLSREIAGINKERLLKKGNIKSNMREDVQLFSPSSVTKGKASRAHRSGPTAAGVPTAAGNSSTGFLRISGTPEDWEHPITVNKVHSLPGVNNRKRSLPAESSSPPMAQWVQRPQKISRNRRTNIVSLASNHGEVHISSEGCGSDFSTRIPGGINGSFPIKNVTNSTQQLIVKFENSPSPARLSESEENSAVQNRQKDKNLCGSEIDERGMNGNQHVSPGLFLKKSKIVVKEEIGDVVRRQGRTGRGPSFSRGTMSPLGEKLENPAAAKPVRSSRPGSEKNGSKSGRPPLKKHSDRKAFTRLGTAPNGSSPDFTGESDDDREELLQAAQFACNASYKGCSSSFWKRMEPLFYVRPEDKSFLEEQLNSVEEHQLSSSEMAGQGDSVVNHLLRFEHSVPQIIARESKNCALDNGLVESVNSGILNDQFQHNDSSYSRPDAAKGPNNLTPLFQRVLSALIVEDEFAEFEDNSYGSNATSSANRDYPFTAADRTFCNGNATHCRFSSIQVSLHKEMEEGHYNYVHQFGQTGHVPVQCDANGPLAISTNASGDFAFECQYDQMCMDKKLMVELQSIGLYPEAVPDLAEGDDEMISHDIAQLKKQLCQQTGKKKVFIDRIYKSAGEKKEVEGWELEQLAMNRLTELAYRKLLATRGSSAARIGISKVSRQVALAFVKRTLARCRMFEDAGKSCFTEPILRDVLFAVPNNNAESVNCISPAEKNMRVVGRASGCEQSDLQKEKSERVSFDAYEALSHQCDHAVARNGPILHRGKKREVLLDDVGGNASARPTSNLGSTLLAGAKGKRSERDSGAKVGRASITNSKGERKTKFKPKQKAAQMSTHPVQPSASGINRKLDDLVSPGNILDSSKESRDSMDLCNLPLHELDSIEELSVANEFDGHQDLTSWLNLDEMDALDGLPDHDSMGLEIPMDDLSELNMLL